MKRLVITSAILTCSTAFAADAPAPSEKAAPTEEIEIVTAVIPPYTYQQLEKQDGIVVKIVEAMAEITGHSGKIKFLPWKRALHETLNPGAGHRMIIPLNRSPEREEKFTWIQELYVDQTVLVTKKEKTKKIADHQDALDLKTGVLLGSPLEAQIRRLGFRRVDAAVNEETNARKLKFGRIDVWHVARLVAPFVYERQGFSPTELEYGVGLDANDLYLGADKNFPKDQAELWRKAYAQIKANGTLKKIIAKYNY